MKYAFNVFQLRQEANIEWKIRIHIRDEIGTIIKTTLRDDENREQNNKDGLNVIAG